MLSQGLIKTLAHDQILESAKFQLSAQAESNNPSINLGSKLIANTLFGKTNLQHDAARSQQLLEELITKQGIPEIEVKKGDLITKKRGKESLLKDMLFLIILA